ncbi:hypothetical protein [Billgrantia montanilacus]|uniref:Uncharacterized protein n=1 Tax=Billgrantia montanilacus TaxID=2282305 RepID=A0A368TQD5_9GAMM|nr:hypothetical protein [Halomonas montanilacus]RCV86949.1 hypothetical protein DU505_19165 [Halomonas montanilacus]
MNYLTHGDKCFLQQLNLANKKQAAMVLDDMFGTQFKPAVGARAIIYGSESCDMYDHAPGCTYYTRDVERPVVVLEPFISLRELRELAVRHFQFQAELVAEWDDKGATYDGMFRPWGVRILNPDDEVIDLYMNGSWATDDRDGLVPRSQWDIVESEIKRLRSEASVEAGWDNFETARHMRQQARRLEDRLSLSRHLLSLSGYAESMR